jgi:hypothetical protein
MPNMKRPRSEGRILREEVQRIMVEPQLKKRAKQSTKRSKSKKKSRPA